jgi:DNA modification methylase
VEVFREVRRVLKDDGTVWLNLGDSYASGEIGRHDALGAVSGNAGITYKGLGEAQRGERQQRRLTTGLKPKDLVGIPWRVAFALQADGWYLRSDIIWSKPNPMPESVTDRPTKAHEYIFLLSKAARYYYDAVAIAEPVSDAMVAQMEHGYDGLGLKNYNAAGVQNPSSVKARIIANARTKASATPRNDGDRWQCAPPQKGAGGGRGVAPRGLGRNKRSVWHVATQPYPEAHFATYPEALIEPCILAGSRLGDTVLDPFTGSGTTGAVAVRHQRDFVGCELSANYIALARTRIGAVSPLFATELTA